MLPERFGEHIDGRDKLRALLGEACMPAEEIIEHVYFEIKNSGLEKKLIAGIVITGGGAQLRHLVQLVEFITGMDTRIGYPNEHIAKGSEELKSPLYATAVGLVIKGFMENDKKKKGAKVVETVSNDKTPAQPRRQQKSFLERLSEIFSDDTDSEFK